ncbi:MAG TPA: hypothetical protein VKA94_08585 [Hyphomicrobiales bacterium]|nr:hypothetical protein [Hyphomicrobiales bacterium]
MSTGLEIRAQIDSENAKGLLLINGGGAVALLAFLPHIIDNDGFLPLIIATLIAIFFFQFGLISAVLHNRYRRMCSLEYEKHGYSPPKRPSACKLSDTYLWVSTILFSLAGITVAIGASISLINRFLH